MRKGSFSLLIMLLGSVNVVCSGADPQGNLKTGGTMSQTASNRQSRNVVINRLRLPDEQVAALEQSYRTRIQDGAYWYDRTSGAWGIEGGPVRGFVPAGMNVGGDLRADASRGNTAVFINGRELPLADVQALQQLGPVLPGRYWVDAYGNCGYEGGPFLLNLVQLARNRGSVHYLGGSVIGSDGKGFLFYQGKDAAGKYASVSSE